MKLNAILPPLAIAASLLLAAQRASAELIINGGFETGDFSGWTELGLGIQGVDPFLPHSGIYAAFFGAVDDTSGIQQTVPTTAGAQYLLTFYLMNEADADPQNDFNNFFLVSWEGNPLAAGTNVAQFDYTLFSFVVTAAASGSLLEFEFQNDEAFFDLDDVSVIDPSVVPEPASFVAWSLAALGLSLACRRRRLRTSGCRPT